MAKITTKTKAPEAYLQQLYLKTEQSLIDEIFRKRAKGYVDYAEVAALERVQATLQGMIDEGFEYVPKMIEKRFYGGSGASGGYANAKGLSAVQTAVEEQLIDALLANVMSAAEKAYETSRTLYRLARLDDDELRKAALVSTAYAEALGKGAYTSAQLMEVSIRNHGITAFVDKAGRNWSLASYCSMATRTTARQAQVAALLTKDDHDLFRIVPHASSCPICAPLEGRVYSKSGADPNYPPLSLAFGKIDPAGSDDLSNTYLNIHPNCLCSLVRYTEIGKTDKEIEAMRRFSNPETNPLDIDPRSKKQVEAYKEKERNRARLLRDRRQFEEYRAILGKYAPKSFAEFRDLRYNKFRAWEVKQREFKTVKALKGKPWDPSFINKAIITYYDFRKEGLELSQHAIGRFLDRSRGAYTLRDIVEQWKKPANFVQPDGRMVKLYDGRAIVYEPDTGVIRTIVDRDSPRKDWGNA